MCRYFLGVVSVVLFLWTIFSGCGGERKETLSTGNGEKEYPSQEGWNSDLFLTSAGHLQAVVRYGHMLKYDEKKLILFDEGVEVDFYDAEGSHASRLTSERGEYHETTEDVIGLGNVVVVSDSGVTLQTEVLRWDNGLMKILSDTVVTVITPDRDTLYGVGFESEPDLSRWIIRKPWGVSDRKVDVEELETSFSKPSSADTVSRPDSTRMEEK